MEAQNTDQPMKRIGLDDPDRVDNIVDRGQELLSRHPVDRTSIFRDHLADLKTIACELDKELVQSAINPQGRFIPHNKLHEVLTHERVQRIVQSLKCFANKTSKDKLADEIYYGSENPHQPPCLKLLAALIGMEKSEDIANHMADEMNDSCFPLEIKDDNNQSILCRHHANGHKTTNEYYRPQYRGDFSTWSYRLSAPFIKREGKLHSHYILDPGDVLPIISIHGTHSGGFSEVYKVRLHESHFDFAGHGSRNPDGFFALKKLNATDEDLKANRNTFNMELSSLLFSEDKAFSVQEHLIQALATFEVVNPSPQNPTWYFLFDWAKGNLNDFWKNNRRLIKDHDHLPWMARQFHGLTKGLMCVHNERTETIKSFDIHKRANSNTLYGRHGDINASNFLWFPSEPPPGILSLSDFGLGRLHREVSRSIQDPQSLKRTETYRAPEFDLEEKSISRISDIFSLGCVFLEYVIWFFRGFKGIKKCSKDRLELDIHNFTADTFFTFNREVAASERQFFVKPSVRALIKELQNDPDCSTYLSQLLDIIGDEMIEPNPSERINAVRLEIKMELLWRTCRDDPEFYTHKDGKPTPSFLNKRQGLTASIR